MKKFLSLLAISSLIFGKLSSVQTVIKAQELPGTLNIATAGDTNMVELQENDVIPMFKEAYDNDINFNVVGTGAGDAGSAAIYEKLKAQKDAGVEEVDIDLAIVHQSIMEDMIAEDLLEAWVPMSEYKHLVTSEGAKNALGTDVEGYVAPLFLSQVAIAFDTTKVEAPFAKFEDLVAWIEGNPNQFGYNGVTNGMSGVAFVTAYTYWATGDYDKLAVSGPYEEGYRASLETLMQDLKALPTTITNGNNGTLDMLNRGEIAAGPVWVDMFNSWQAEGRMSENVELCIPEPGLPGQPMYVVIPKNALNKDNALKFADFLISPEVQASVIVEKYNWYPGINSDEVMDLVSEEGKNRLFKNITPEILSEYGLSLPLNQYLADIQEAYEIY